MESAQNIWKDKNDLTKYTPFLDIRPKTLWEIMIWKINPVMTQSYMLVIHLPFNDRFWNQKDLLMRSKKISMGISGTGKMQTEHLILKNMPIWIEMLNFQQQQ